MLVMYHHGRGTAVALRVDQLRYLPWLIPAQLYIRVGVSREPRESRERGDAGVALVERQKGSSEGTRPRGRGSIER